MEDETCHMQHHTNDNKVYWSFNVFVSFSFPLCNTIIDDSCLPALFRLGSSNTSGASPIRRVYRLTLKICRVLMHFPRSEGTRR